MKTHAEDEIAAYIAQGHSRTRATELAIESATARAREASVVVLVEGVSDQIALEIIASRIGRRLSDEGVAVVPMGGATNLDHFISLFRRRRIAGLYDAGEEAFVRRAVARAGLSADAFFPCVEDLEDEFIRSVGVVRVESIIEEQGHLRSLRTMQREPHHRSREIGDQVHRFIGRDRYRYARALAEAVDIECIPSPLGGLLRYASGSNVVASRWNPCGSSQ